MLKVNQLVGFGAGNLRTLKTANASDFNGSSDYLSRSSDFTGNADSPFGILSMWIRVDGGDGILQTLFGSSASPSNRIVLRRDSSNNLILGYSATFQIGMSGGTVTASSAWRHILLSWDTNHAAGSKLTHFYLDGAAPTPANVDTDTAFSVDYTQTDWALGAFIAGLQPFNGAISEFYFAPGQYLDFSQDYNREAFRSSTGKPVDLGTDGSLPTGTPPLIYLPNSAATVNVNAGTGGNFTINGSTTAASTSPSD